MAEQRSNIDRIQRDLSLIIGGNFTSDALGVERREATIARVRAAPETYLEAFDQLVADLSAPAVAERRPTAFLRLLVDIAPEQVRESAQRLAGRLAASPQERIAFDPPDLEGETDPEEVERAEQRWEQLLQGLDLLSGGGS